MHYVSSPIDGLIPADNKINPKYPNTTESILNGNGAIMIKYTAIIIDITPITKGILLTIALTIIIRFK